MKKMFILAVVVTVLAASVALAQESVSTMIDIRNDFIAPEKGENQTA